METLTADGRVGDDDEAGVNCESACRSVSLDDSVRPHAGRDEPCLDFRTPTSAAIWTLEKSRACDVRSPSTAERI